MAWHERVLDDMIACGECGEKAGVRLRHGRREDVSDTFLEGPDGGGLRGLALVDE